MKIKITGRNDEPMVRRLFCGLAPATVIKGSAGMTLFKLVIALCIVLLFGCAAPTWNRANTTEGEMRRDLEQCERDRKEVAGESFFLERCMFSKGYSEE
ncbi:MAG TPA: hypothetical protein VIE89_08045 [Candidatus Binatia bacterium]|jgi:hypothetical protein